MQTLCVSHMVIWQYGNGVSASIVRPFMSRLRSSASLVLWSPRTLQFRRHPFPNELQRRRGVEWGTFVNYLMLFMATCVAVDDCCCCYFVAWMENGKWTNGQMETQAAVTTVRPGAIYGFMLLKLMLMRIAETIHAASTAAETENPIEVGVGILCGTCPKTSIGPP